MNKKAIVEKKNHLAIHGIFDSQTAAENHLIKNIPVHAARGYFMDKTLKAEDFEIIDWIPKQKRKRKQLGN